eukprot:357016-Chlamydomonas_euryale.AAC.2
MPLCCLSHERNSFRMRNALSLELPHLASMRSRMRVIIFWRLLLRSGKRQGEKRGMRDGVCVCVRSRQHGVVAQKHARGGEGGGGRGQGLACLRCMSRGAGHMASTLVAPCFSSSNLTAGLWRPMRRCRQVPPTSKLAASNAPALGFRLQIWLCMPAPGPEPQPSTRMQELVNIREAHSHLPSEHATPTPRKTHVTLTLRRGCTSSCKCPRGSPSSLRGPHCGALEGVDARVAERDVGHRRLERFLHRAGLQPRPQVVGLRLLEVPVVVARITHDLAARRHRRDLHSRVVVNVVVVVVAAVAVAVAVCCCDFYTLSRVQTYLKASLASTCIHTGLHTYPN